MFGYWKVAEKKNMLRKIIFLYLVSTMKNMKENQMLLKLLKDFYIFKLFNIYIE